MLRTVTLKYASHLQGLNILSFEKLIEYGRKFDTIYCSRSKLRFYFKIILDTGPKLCQNSYDAKQFSLSVSFLTTGRLTIRIF
jgi:hypothetical protein